MLWNRLCRFVCTIAPALITGERYPKLTRLRGNVTGQLSNMGKANGMLRTLINASMLAMQHQGVVYFWAGPEAWLVFIKPEDLKALVADGFEKNLVTRGPSFDFFIQLFGEGLITAPRTEWKTRRACAYTPVMLKRERLQHYLPTSHEVIAAFLQQKYQENKKNQNFSPLSLLIEEFVLVNLMATFFNITDTHQCFEVVKRSLPFLRQYLQEVFRFRNIAKFRTPPALRKIIYWGEETSSARIQRNMQEEFIQSLGDLRHLVFDNPNNFVSHLRDYMTQKDGIAPDDHVLAGEVIVNFFAGWDSTATTVHWTIRALEEFSHIKQRLLTELQKSEDPLQCDYLDKVIREAMRLYPPFPMLTRGAEAPFLHEGIKFKRRSIMIFPLIAIHRNPVTWGPDADHFDPDRFHPDRFTEQQKKAYKPFGLGQQSCVGMNFAMQIMKLFIAHLYTTYDTALIGNRVSLEIDFAHMDKTATLDIGGTTKPLDYNDTWFNLAGLKHCPVSHEASQHEESKYPET